MSAAPTGESEGWSPSRGDRGISPGPGPLPAADPLQIVHVVPGRMRLRWRALRAAPPERAGEIADACIRGDGILDVSVSLGTGSVLVLYDREVLSADEAAGIVRRACGGPRLLEAGEEPPPLPAPPPSKEPSRLAVATAAFFEQVNEDVRRATDGHADLATLLPVGFVGFGLLEVAVTGDVPAPPWWSLFWWSFRSFISLNDPAIKAAARANHVHPAAEAA